MDAVEWAVGFATFLAVAVVISIALEDAVPGSAANPFIGAGVGAVAGWMVTKLFGDD
jgi:hypothetical protein